MARGIWKIHHAIQTQEARKDWATLAQQAAEAGHGELAAKLAPAEDAGWRTIDRRIFKLCADLGWTWNVETRRADKGGE